MENVIPCNLIVDCDEILCNICPKWVNELYKRKDKFKDVFDFSKIENNGKRLDEIQFKNTVMNRDKESLEDWLLKEELDEIPDEIDNLFHSCYEVEDFYEDLPITKMARAISSLASQDSIKRVYVITKVRDNNVNMKSKLPFIKSLFPMNKLEIRVVPLDGKKSDYVKDIDITAGFIFEDSLGNVKDYLKSGISNCNIYIPTLGYNVPDTELYEIALLNRVGVTYYSYDK